ncbi:uncharacterized protein PGTG_20613 [Puccinia graminis f. sp. tritici CRL 75-36-700-3]|uniref:Uncharacterized protein n=1 Tax=Puccinia graminis f. sp. tritici (strain CRL 75-36-700-3 / race SCCL) TaxID=418459 RepID=H6QNU8_PUCGT|nr:uncharacterized protein PGTG_20613 [Puccinia graminis f. sp. tritici CRL 75-36-700-3]EHS62490.1 hypothetical protein PGTG_20613 [Puccinia graminis f. sp. tritici CRL 75-36-700-3]
MATHFQVLFSMLRFKGNMPFLVVIREPPIFKRGDPFNSTNDPHFGSGPAQDLVRHEIARGG